MVSDSTHQRRSGRWRTYEDSRCILSPLDRCIGAKGSGDVWRWAPCGRLFPLFLSRRRIACCCAHSFQGWYILSTAIPGRDVPSCWPSWRRTGSSPLRNDCQRSHDASSNLLLVRTGRQHPASFDRRAGPPHSATLSGNNTALRGRDPNKWRTTSSLSILKQRCCVSGLILGRSGVLGCWITPFGRSRKKATVFAPGRPSPSSKADT